MLARSVPVASIFGFAVVLASMTSCRSIYLVERGMTSGTGASMPGGAGGSGSASTTSGASRVGAPWPMMGHDPAHTSRSASVQAASRKSWTFQSVGVSFSAPVIAADGTVYVTASDGRLHAVDSAGAEKWSVHAANGGGSKNFATAAIANDGSIYVGDGSSLESIDPEGHVKWSSPIPAVVYTSPAIGADGTVYVTAADDRLHAFTNEGQELWATPVPGAGTGSGQPSSPAIGADGTSYVLNTVFSSGSATGTLFAVRADGSMKWATPIGAYTLFGPVVGSDGTIYAGTESWLKAVGPDGGVRWTAMANLGVTSALAIGTDGTVYAFDGGFETKLHAIAPDGTERWSIHASSSSAPVVGSDGSILLTAGDAVFAAHSDGTVSSPTQGNGAGASPPAIAGDGTLVFSVGTSLIARPPQ